MALRNDYLTRSRREKNDEFFTDYDDVEREMVKFRERFSGKRVLMPCDDIFSAFYLFFRNVFSEWGIRELVCIGIDGNGARFDGKKETPITEKTSIVKEGCEANGMKYYGEYLKACDIVVTNPPFSLFIPFINGLVESGKDFLIIGQQNTLTCKDVFAHVTGHGVSIDYGFPGIAGYFHNSKYKDIATAGEHIRGMIRVSGVIWYTTFPVESKDRNVPIDPEKRYYLPDGTENEAEYPKYDNFRTISGLDEDAINVDRIKDIPCDYYGIMGVPITLLGKHNGKQFEIIQLDHYGPLGNQDNVVGGKQKYRRIYVKRIKH